MFESLIHDGKIRLRVAGFAPAILSESLYRIDGAYQLTGLDTTRTAGGWEIVLSFDAKPPYKEYVSPDCHGIITAETMYGTADFDAVLKSLEPYEVIEPILDAAQAVERWGKAALSIWGPI